MPVSRGFAWVVTRCLPVLLLLLLVASSAAFPAPEAPLFGVVVQPDRTRPQAVGTTFAAVREAGVQAVRILPDWRVLQPAKGAYDWGWSDLLVRSAREQGLQIVFTLGYTPKWASRFSTSTEPDGWARNPPAETARWEEYVRKASARYGDAVTRWQVWEQPSLHQFRGSWKDMRDLAAATMRGTRGRPRTVILPESGSLNLSALDETWRWGTDVYSDALGLYPAFEKPEDMLRPLRTLRAMVDR